MSKVGSFKDLIAYQKDYKLADSLGEENETEVRLDYSLGASEITFS